MKKNYYSFRRKSFRNFFLLTSACALASFSPRPTKGTPPFKSIYKPFFDPSEYVQFTVSGFNEDVVANGVGPASETTTNSVDAQNYVFAEIGAQFIEGGVAITTGLPQDGVLTNPSNADITFQLEDYSGNNVLRLQEDEAEGTLTFSESDSFETIYMAVTSGDGASTVGGTINFGDGTTQEFSGLAVSDWFNGANPIISGIGRKSRTSTAGFEANSTNPRIYQLSIAVAAENQGKTVTGVTVVKEGAGGVFNLFAVTGKLVPTCIQPGEISLTSVTTTGAELSWVAAEEGDVFEYAYVEAGQDAPTEGEETTTATASLTGLAAGTSYEFYVRTNCGEVDGTSAWTGPFSFATDCDVYETLEEDFEGDAVPNCWSIINDGDANGWELYNGTTFSHSGTQAMRIQYSSSAHDDYLITPAFTVVDHISDYINFWALNYSATYVDEFNVLVSTSGNAKEDFTEVIASNVAPGTSYTEYEYDLSAYEGETVYVAIQAISTNEWLLYIDDFSTSGEPYCLIPENVASSSVGAYGATVSWDAADATAWEIAVVESGEEMPTEGTSVSESTYTFDAELTPETSYTAYVRTDCDEDGYSEWVSVGFTTTVSCVAPTDVFVSDVTTTSASIYWTAGFEDQTSWEVSYVMEGEEMPETGVSVAETTFDLSGLMSATAYNVYVRANCGETDGDSEWVMISFMTACEAYESIDEDFEGDTVPDCWTIINDGDANGWTLYNGTTYAHSGSNAMRIQYSSSAHDDFLITPGFTVVEHVTDMIGFWVRNYSATYVDEFNVLVSTTGVAKADFTDTLASNVAPGTTYTEYQYDLSAYEGQTIYVAIQAISTNEWYLYVDDVMTFGTDICAAPTNLAAADITPTTATLTWEDEVASSWEIVVQEEGSGEPTLEGVLVEETTYDAAYSAGTVAEFYVRAVCESGEGYSPWAGPFAYGGYTALEISEGQNFDVIANGVGTSTASTTNNVDGANFAFVSQDFKAEESDDDLTFGLPVNGVIASTNTAGLNYQMSDYSANNSLRISGTGLENGGTITIANAQPAEMLYLLVTSGSGSGSIIGSINYTDGTSQNIFTSVVPDWYSSTSLPIAASGFGRVDLSNDNVENPTGNPRLYELSIMIGQVHQSKTIGSITLQKTSGDGVVNVFAASVKYSSAAAAVDGVSQSLVKVYPNPVQNQLSIQGVTVTGVEVYNMLGQRVAAKLANNTVDMSGLEAGVYLVTIQSQSATQTVRVIKK